MSGGAGSLAGAARLAVGLLTVLPAGAVDADRTSARNALLLAPLVGAALGLLGWTVGGTLLSLGLGPLVAATAAVGALALATRALHLDGLADLADGLGSGRPAAAALEVMRRSDAGPFGVVTLVLVLLAQVAALTRAYEVGLAAPCLVIGCTTGRLTLLWACRSGVPAARPDGLGALVAGTVPGALAVVVTAVVVAACAAWGAVTGVSHAAAFVLAVLAGTAGAALLQQHAVRRLGGVTGDVLGALVETALTASVLTLLIVAG